MDGWDRLRKVRGSTPSSDLRGFVAAERALHVGEAAGHPSACGGGFQLRIDDFGIELRTSSVKTG